MTKEQIKDKILTDRSKFRADEDYYKHRLEEVSPYASLWQTVSCNYSAAKSVREYLDELVYHIDDE